MALRFASAKFCRCRRSGRRPRCARLRSQPKNNNYCSDFVNGKTSANSQSGGLRGPLDSFAYQLTSMFHTVLTTSAPSRTQTHTLLSPQGHISPQISPGAVEEQMSRPENRLAESVHVVISSARSLPSAGLPDKGSLARRECSTTKLYMPSSFLGVITGLSRVRSSLPCAL